VRHAVRSCTYLFFVLVCMPISRLTCWLHASARVRAVACGLVPITLHQRGCEREPKLPWMLVALLQNLSMTGALIFYLGMRQ
jgi:hypothetical protein